MLSFYTNAVQPERGISGVHVSLFNGKLPAQLAILVALSLSAVVLVPTVPRAHAQATTLTIQPPNQGSLAVGSTFKFNVTVTNTPFTFAGWDITVVTDNTVLSPQSITLCNTTACNVQYSDSGGTNFMPGGTDAQCINGVNSGAFNVCAGNDGPGVAHDAFASSGFTGGALLLFTITYKVIASGTTNVVLGPDLTHPESTTGTTNHLLDNNGIDIIADETGGFYGSVAPTLISVVKGTDNNLYYNTFAGGWGGTWQALNGQTPSPPSLCSSGPTTTELVIRGTDNGIYHKTFSGSTFSATWDRNPNGVTSMQPVCSVLGTTLYVVVVGPTGEIWSTTFDLSAHTWAAWTDLSGATASAPALAATPSLTRLDLVVRGTNNLIYHKAFTSNAWAPAWDTSNRSPVPDKTIGAPAIVSDGSQLHVVVIGTEGNLWYATLSFTGVWSTYTSLVGSTPANPVLVIDSANTLHLVVTGSDGHVYGKAHPSGGSWDPTWTSAGGIVSGTPGVTTIGSTVHIVVKGGDARLWYNTLSGTTWSGYVFMNGAANLAASLSTP